MSKEEREQKENQAKIDKQDNIFYSILGLLLGMALIINVIRYFNSVEVFSFRSILVALQEIFQSAIIEIPSIPRVDFGSGLGDFIETVVNMFSSIINVLIFLANGIIQIIQVVVLLFKNIFGF